MYVWMKATEWAYKNHSYTSDWKTVPRASEWQTSAALQCTHTTEVRRQFLAASFLSCWGENRRPQEARKREFHPFCRSFFHYMLRIHSTRHTIETKNGGSWAGEGTLTSRRPSWKTANIRLPYLYLERELHQEYIVEHRCTEWELERVLFQYLKSMVSTVSSLDSSA